MNSRQTLLHQLRIDVHAAWLAVRDPQTPAAARLVGLLVTAYALSPIDLVPDFIPVLGLLDDAVIIPAGIWLFVKLLPPGSFERHRTVAEKAAERPMSAWGAILVVMIWVLVAAALWALWSFSYD